MKIVTEFTERDKRRAVLRADEERLHALYMATPDDNLPALRALEAKLRAIVGELDEMFRQDQAEWGKNDDRALREKLADAAYGRWLAIGPVRTVEEGSLDSRRQRRER